MSSTDRLNRAVVDVQIAQFRLKQALKRDEADISQEESTKFCNALAAVFERNTAVNVQVTTLQRMTNLCRPD
jgi:hypothetical protein